jgi:hypothetical protein
MHPRDHNSPDHLPQPPSLSDSEEEEEEVFPGRQEFQITIAPILSPFSGGGGVDGPWAMMGVMQCVCGVCVEDLERSMREPSTRGIGHTYTHLRSLSPLARCKYVWMIISRVKWEFSRGDHNGPVVQNL